MARRACSSIAKIHVGDTSLGTPLLPWSARSRSAALARRHIAGRVSKGVALRCPNSTRRFSPQPLQRLGPLCCAASDECEESAGLTEGKGASMRAYSNMKHWILRVTVAFGSALSLSLASFAGVDCGAFAALGCAVGALYFELLCSYVDSISSDSQSIRVGGKLNPQTQASQLASYIARNAVSDLITALNSRVMAPIAAVSLCAGTHIALGFSATALHTGCLLGGFMSQKAATLLWTIAGPQE